MAFAGDHPTVTNPMNRNWLVSQAMAVMPRAACLVTGPAMILAGVILIFVATQDPAEALMRGVLSFLCIAGGGVLLHMGFDRSVCELQFDPRVRKVMLLRRDDRGRSWMLARFDYDEVAHIEATDTRLELVNCYGVVLASLPLDGPNARLSALAQLRMYLPRLF